MADAIAHAARVGTHMIDNFRARDRKHEEAKARIIPVFNKWGLDTYDHGIEFSDALKDAVQDQDDRCSIMLRFRPDIAGVFPGGLSCLCEVKYQGKRDWKIEARSFSAICEWNAGGSIAMLALLCAQTDALWGSWVIDIPLSEVIVPKWHINRAKEHDWERQVEAMEKLFPEVPKRPLDSPSGYAPGQGPGSGTPFVNLRKASFKPLDSFIAVDLLGLPDPAVPQLSMDCG